MVPLCSYYFKNISLVKYNIVVNTILFVFNLRYLRNKSVFTANLQFFNDNLYLFSIVNKNMTQMSTKLCLC